MTILVFISKMNLDPDRVAGIFDYLVVHKVIMEKK